MSNPYRVHAFVCLGGKTCPQQGSEALWLALKERIGAEGLKDEIRISKSGCVGQCGHGPMVCVYPDDVWYAAVKVEDLDAIVAHLKGGPVASGRIYVPPGPGANKVEVSDR